MDILGFSFHGPRLLASENSSEPVLQLLYPDLSDFSFKLSICSDELSAAFASDETVIGFVIGDAKDGSGAFRAGKIYN